MKHFNSLSFCKTTQRTLVIVALFLVSFSGYAQSSAPVLVFKNGTLVSGNAGQDGAVYNFPNVTPGVDANITIAGRYSSDGNKSNVVLTEMDQTGTGYDSAWQPLINYANGSGIKSTVVTDWYIEFQIAFVKSGNNKATTVKSFDVSGLDIDGSTNLHESMSFYNLNTYTLENPTSLAATSVTSSIIDVVNGLINFLTGNPTTTTQNGKRFDAGSVEYTGIDVTASSARVTSHYVNTSNFTMRIGGKATGPISIGNGGRQNSVYFQSFNYTNPVIHTLPVIMESFDAQLKNSSSVSLQWITASEVNANHFVVQRSIDGNEFTDIAVIAAEEGNSSTARTYNYANNIGGLNSSLVYYRLKMVDMDTKYAYSEVVMIRLSKQQDELSLVTFPNPAINELRVTIPSAWQNKTVTYNMYNLSGSLVQQKVKTNAGQTEVFNIAQAPAGLYIIEVSNGTARATQKFIKTK